MGRGSRGNGSPVVSMRALSMRALSMTGLANRAFRSADRCCVAQQHDSGRERVGEPRARCRPP